MMNTNRKVPLLIASWNMRTMYPGYNSDSQNVTDLRKTAMTGKELGCLNIDVAALQETRLPKDGSLHEHDYTFFWRGKGTEEARIHGVGAAVRNSMLQFVEPPSVGSEWLLTMWMQTHTGPVTHMHLCSNPDLFC